MKKIILCLMLCLGLCGEAQAQKMKLEPGELTDQIKSDKGTRFAYQVSAVGFEAGSKNFRCFVEFGYGFQGFAQIGGSITF